MNQMILPDPNPFELSVAQVGYEKCDREHFYGPCKRGFYVLHVVVSGGGIYRIRGQSLRLKRGDVFLVTPSDDTFYQADPEDPYEYYWFAFQGVGIRQRLVNAGFFRNEVFVQHVSEETCAAMQALMAELLALGHPSSRNDLLFVSGFCRLLAGLTPEQPYEYVHIYNSLYERINLYLEVNYMYEISMETFSYYTGLHRSSIYRFFKRQYGKSPTEYIQEFRLQKAYSILTNSDMPINQIAFSCGFNDMSHFTKLFRRKYGISPKEIRQKKKTDADQK